MPTIVDHDERRERIAEAAWRVIEREGPEGANLRRIAREAGHTTGVVTAEYAGKWESPSRTLGLFYSSSTVV